MYRHLAGTVAWWRHVRRPHCNAGHLETSLWRHRDHASDANRKPIRIRPTYYTCSSRWQVGLQRYQSRSATQTCRCIGL